MARFVQDKLKRFILTLTSLALLAVPVIVLAQGTLDTADDEFIKLKPKLGNVEEDLGTSVGTAINAALGLVGLIFLVLMVYAGFLWMTARGDSEKVDSAQKIIIASVIGLVIVVSAYAISVLVTSKFTS